MYVNAFLAFLATFTRYLESLSVKKILPSSKTSLLGRIMSDRMMFSVPYSFRKSLANPVPNCPRPPKNVRNDYYVKCLFFALPSKN